MSRKLLLGIALATGLLAVVSFFIWKKSSNVGKQGQAVSDSANAIPADTIPSGEPPLAVIPIAQTVTIAAYFKYIDDLVHQYDTLVPYVLSEHLLVRANPWLIDTLESTDYYRQIAQGNFVFEQRKMAVLKPCDTLFLPGPQTAAVLLAKMKNTRLDINIPAFQLRIIEGDSVLYTFPVRVGKNQKKFLAMAGGEVDLRTHTGTGEIVRINRSPVFYDPVTGRQFKYTKRDDGKTTLMPQIPWLEPVVNGRRYGQMIHPTTNPSTLNKAASNGCIGLGEADAWRVYYYAPIGTKLVVRYDLVEINPLGVGDTLLWNDIYRYGNHNNNQYAATLSPKLANPNQCWCLP